MKSLKLADAVLIITPEGQMDIAITEVFAQHFSKLHKKTFRENIEIRYNEDHEEFFLELPEPEAKPKAKDLAKKAPEEKEETAPEEKASPKASAKKAVKAPVKKAAPKASAKKKAAKK